MSDWAVNHDQFTTADWALLAASLFFVYVMSWISLFIDEAEQDAEDRNG